MCIPADRLSLSEKPMSDEGIEESLLLPRPTGGRWVDLPSSGAGRILEDTVSFLFLDLNRLSSEVQTNGIATILHEAVMQL